MEWEVPVARGQHGRCPVRASDTLEVSKGRRHHHGGLHRSQLVVFKFMKPMSSTQKTDGTEGGAAAAGAEAGGGAAARTETGRKKHQKQRET